MYLCMYVGAIHIMYQGLENSCLYEYEVYEPVTVKFNKLVEHNLVLLTTLLECFTVLSTL